MSFISLRIPCVFFLFHLSDIFQSILECLTIDILSDIILYLIYLCIAISDNSRYLLADTKLRAWSVSLISITPFRKNWVKSNDQERVSGKITIRPTLEGVLEKLTVFYSQYLYKHVIDFNLVWRYKIAGSNLLC